MKIAIIGGSGDFGRIFAKLFKEDGYRVVITGRNASKGKRVAKELGVEFTNDNVKAAEESDVVVISVYVENTEEVIKEVAPHVKSGSLLTDVTSVKVEPCRAMEKFAGDGVEIIGTHPMFGPRVSSIDGLTFIVTPVRMKKWKDFLFNFLEKRNAKIFVTTPEEHDRIMSVVQGLTHFAYIATAATLKKLDIDVKYSRNFASPVYALMLDFIARIVGQSPRLYASIQMHNPLVRDVHKAFVEQAENLKEIVSSRDVKAFKKVMIESARHIGDIDASMGRSDKAIIALTDELKRLGNSIGKEIALKHIYSGAIHIGKVKKVCPDGVTLVTSRGKTLLLNLSNVELLDDAFLENWKHEHLPRRRRDFSLVFQENVNDEVIVDMIKAWDRRIISCSVVDRYKGRGIPKGKKSLTIRVEAIDFKNADFEKVRGVLEGIGGVLR